MSKTAAEFLNELEKRTLVPAGVLASLKNQVAKAAKPVASAAVAKLLVEKGHLTAAQAQQLLGAPSAASAPSPRVASASPAAPELPSLDDLMPLHDLQPLDTLQPLDDLQPLDELPPLQEATAAAAVIPLDDLTAHDPLAAASRAQAAAGKSQAPASSRPGAAAVPAPVRQPAPAQTPGNRRSALGLVAVVLVVLVLVGCGAAAALLLLPRGGGEEAFAAAQADFQAQQFDAASAKFQAFLADYPASKQAAAARVRLAAAKVLGTRAASPQSWQAVLATAKEELPAVAGLPEFADVHAQIAPLVMDMAVELANDAADGPAAAQKLAVAREAWALADDGRIVPGAMRQWQRLELAADQVALAEYGAARAPALEAASAAMKAAAQSGDVPAFYAERAKLLARYPELAGDSALRESGRALAANAAGEVQTAEYSTAAESAERAAGIVGSVVLTTPLTSVQASEAGPPVVIAALGSVFGLDSATGRVLWRRGGAIQPARTAGEAADNVVLVEDDGHELACIEARSGRLLWRHRYLSPLVGAPLVAAGHVITVTQTGQVVALDVKSGVGLAVAQLPQLARIGAVADAAGKYVIQIADQGLLYVLAAEDLNCTRAIYIGHEPAAVVAPPVVLPKHLVLAENRGIATCILHVMALDGGGLPAEVVQTIELAGHAFAPPVVLSGKLLAATSAGRVWAYESAVDPMSGLKEVAKADLGSVPGDSAAGAVRHLLVAGDRLIAAGQGLRLFAPPAAGTLRSVWTALEGDTFIGPPQVVGDTVVTVRRQTGKRGVVAAGMNFADGKIRWETRLAEPIERLTMADDFAAVEPTSYSGATAKIALAELADNKVIAWTPAVAATSVAQRSDRGRRFNWRDGQVVITPTGTLSLVDSATGALKAEPYQLRPRPGERLERADAAATGDGGRLLAVSDGRSRLALLDLAGEASLSEVASVDLQSSPISGLAAGDAVVGLVDRRGQLATWSLPDLQAGTTIDLGASFVLAGPARIGQYVVLATDRAELVGLDHSLAVAWRTPLTHGVPAGDLADGGTNVVLASREGWLCTHNAATGKEIAAVDLGEPLAGAPVVSGSEAVIATADGTILRVKLPTQAEAAP